MIFDDTPQQVNFLNALRNGKGHLALVARAGCGKTSTILRGVDILAAINPRHEIVVAAYNKAIADEVKEKLVAAGHTGRNVSAATLHSLGYGLVRFAFNNPKVEANKVRNLVRSLNEPAAELYGPQVERLVGYAKAMGVGFFSDVPIESPNTWYDLMDHYDINSFEETTDSEEVVNLARRVYQMSLAQTDVVDFDDMILFPLIKNLRVKFTKDYLFLDEAQDLSRTRQALARKFVNPRGGRMIVVGDDRQAIYGFSGADSSALPNLIEQMGATVLPLSVTWRCPKAVVALAQTLVPDIEAAAEAPEGEVLHLEEFPTDLVPGDALLCRNTAPLVTTAYSLLRKGIPCKVEGRQIGDGLINLAKRWKVKSIDALLHRLDDYMAREQQKAMARGNEQKAAEVEDRVQTLVEICQECIKRGTTSVADVVTFIEDLFADGVDKVVVLATYHRSKGREWDRVFLIEHDTRCPSRAARAEWQIQQEHNLAYVAFTRAKRVLAFVGS